MKTKENWSGIIRYKDFRNKYGEILEKNPEYGRMAESKFRENIDNGILGFHKQHRSPLYRKIYYALADYYGIYHVTKVHKIYNYLSKEDIQQREIDAPYCHDPYCQDCDSSELVVKRIDFEIKNLDRTKLVESYYKEDSVHA